MKALTVRGRVNRREPQNAKVQELPGDIASIRAEIGSLSDAGNRIARRNLVRAAAFSVPAQENFERIVDFGRCRTTLGRRDADEARSRQEIRIAADQRRRLHARAARGPGSGRIRCFGQPEGKRGCRSTGQSLAALCITGRFSAPPGAGLRRLYGLDVTLADASTAFHYRGEQ